MTDADGEAAFGIVERFAALAVEPHAARPEAPMSDAHVAELLDEASALGIAAGAEGPSGLGIWDDLDDPTCAERSVRMLARLGTASAGFAWAVHQRALGAAIARSVGLPSGGALVALPYGSFGIGRASLARLVCAAALDDEDRELLADVYGAASARVVSADAHFDALVLPAWDEGTLRWARFERDALDVATHDRAHGLDELATFSARPLHRASAVSGAESPRSTATFVAALGATQLAIVAIASASVERAHRKAREFAAQRRQGGSLIDRHDAVRLLLATSETTLRSTSAWLPAAARARGLDGFFERLALRAHLHPLLADAVNDAMQTFGGVGYMRDAGIEKLVRDVSHLRALAGSPRELALVLAEGARLRG